MDNKEFSPALWSLEPNVTEDPSEILGILTFEGDKGFELEILAGVLLDWPKTPIEGGFMQAHTVEGLRVDHVYGFSQTGDYFFTERCVFPRAWNCVSRDGAPISSWLIPFRIQATDERQSCRKVYNIQNPWPT